MNFFDIFEIILRLFVVCSSPIALLYAMSSFRCKKRTAWVVFSGIVVFGTSLCTLLLIMEGLERMRWVYALILMIPCLLFLFFASRDKWSQIFFNFFTAINALYLASILSHFILGGKEEPIWADALIRAAIYLLILFIFVRYLREPYRFLSKNMKRGWNVIALIPFLFFALVMFLGMYPHIRSDNLVAVVFLYVILGFVYFIIYQVFCNTYSLLHQQMNNDALKLQISTLKQQMDMANRNEEQIRIYRHDTRHFAANAISLLREGKPEQALEVLESYEAHSSGESLPRYCKNTTVNATLSLYLQRAMDAGIQVTSLCDIPQTLPVDGLELAMVCANAIENAIHACLRLPDTAKKRIVVRCVSTPQLVLEVANTYDGNVEFDKNHYPVTTEEGHGIGTRSILFFAQKYNAFLNYKADAGMFRIRLLINLEQPQEDKKNS